jgi:hypothetical protein
VSTGCATGQGCPEEDGVYGGELRRTEQPTPASACSVTGRRRCAGSTLAASKLRVWRRSEWARTGVPRRG